jgi:hypothetical protein
LISSTLGAGCAGCASSLLSFSVPCRGPELLAVILVSGSLVFCDSLGEARTCRDVRRLRFVGGRGIVVLLSDPETSDAAR